MRSFGFASRHLALRGSSKSIHQVSDASFSVDVVLSLLAQRESSPSPSPRPSREREREREERESAISSLSHRDPTTPDIAQKKADRFELLVCATMPNPNTTLHINSEMSTVHPLKSSPPLLATHRAFAQKAKLPTFIIVQSTFSHHGLRYTNIAHAY